MRSFVVPESQCRRRWHGGARQEKTARRLDRSHGPRTHRTYRYEVQCVVFS